MRIRQILLAVVVGFLPVLSNAQSDAEAVKKEVKAFMEETRKELGGLINPAEFLNFINNNLTKDYKVHTRVYYDGVKEKDERETLSEFLAEINNQNVSRLPYNRENYANDSILFLEVTGDVAVVGSSNSISYQEDGNITSEAKEFRVDRLKKVDGKWKFQSTTSDVVVTSLTRATCYYQYFSDGSPVVLIRVSYPAGPMYDAEILQLTYKSIQDNVFEVKTDRGDDFIWRGGQLTGIQDQRISIPAKDRVQVAEKLILRYWSRQCQNLKSTK